MSYAQGDLLRFTTTLQDTRFSGVFKNIVNFRIISGEIDQAAGTGFISDFVSVWWERMLNNLATSTYIRHVRLQNVRKASSPDEEMLYDSIDWFGDLIAEAGDVPQAAAAFTRRAYQKGRKGIGHFYLGPLPARFASNGFIVVDPNLLGDLNDVMDALGDPIESQGIVMRPIVHPGDDSPPNASQDVRATTLAQQVVYLKSRRPLQGE